MAHFSPVFAVTEGEDSAGFAAAFAEELAAIPVLAATGYNVGAGITAAIRPITTVRPAAPTSALVGMPCFLRPRGAGVFYTPCQLWAYSAQPGVIDVVYGPLVTSAWIPPQIGAGPVVPTPVAGPAVTLAALTVTRWTPEAPPVLALPLTTITDPPPVASLPAGFYVATANTVTGTPGSQVALPEPFEMLHLTLPTSLPVLGQGEPTWLGEMP